MFRRSIYRASGSTSQVGAFGYNYDATGRPISVTGSNYAGVTSYVSNIAYRAFGMKQMNYANGKTLSLSYDNRMRMTQWNVPGVMGWNYAYNYFGENTGRVTFAQNLYDGTLDRSYDYDALGRMWASHSGKEARWHIGVEGYTGADGPYAENYSFDQLGNMTWRNGWGVANAQYNYGPQFVNNKMTVNPVTGAGVGYDASGNLTNDGSQSYSYDATGQQTYASGSGGGGGPSFSAPDPLVAGVTEVKAVHITELRTAINQVRAGVRLGAYSWTYSVTTNDWITAGPILEMRTALDQVLGAPSGGYAAGLAQGQPILAIHIQELRDRVKTALGSSALTQSYDGDRLRGKKSEYGATTYYVRSSVLGGQVIAELGASGNWAKGYVYLGGQMLAIQNGAVNWVHQDPVTKSQRATDAAGNIVGAGTIDLDPWGGETNRSANSAFQPHKYTSYERDGNGGDDAMHRRYQSNWTRFSQPDPYDGSYSLTNPQSFNRYAYVNNDPVNFVDPSGLNLAITGGFDCQVAWEGWQRIMGTGMEEFGQFLPGCVTSGGSGGGGGEPVEPGGGGGGPNRDDLEKRITKIASNPKCADFIKNLISGTATAKNSAEFTDALTGLEKIQGFTYGDTIERTYGYRGGTVRGTMSGRDTQVELPFPIPFRSFGPVNQRAAAGYAEAQAGIQAMIALHEILHLAGRNQFSDFAYANTVANMRGINPPTFANVAEASLYWNSALESACKPRN